MSPSGVQVRRFCFAALVVLTLALRLINLDPGLTEQDGWRQTDTATIAENFLGEPNIFYPKINWGAPGPGYVEAEFQLYPYAVHLLYRILGVHPIIGRLLSIVLIGVAALVLARIAARYLPPWPACIAAVVFLWTPLVFRYSRNFMPEALVLVLYLLALDTFLRFLDDDRLQSMLVSGVWMALAILVKPTSIHLGLALIVLTLARGGPRLLFSGRLVGFLAVSLLPPVCYYFHAARLHLIYGNTFGVISGGDSKWGDLSWWTNPEFYRHLLRTEKDWILGGKAGVVAVAVGLWKSRRSKLLPLACSLAVSIFIYYLIAARYTGSGRGLHYHVYAAAPASLLIAASLGGLRWRGPWRLPTTIGSGAAVVVLFVVVAGQAAMNVQTLRSASAFGTSSREAGVALGEVSNPDEYAVVVSSDVAVDEETGVPNNYEQPNVLFHAKRRGRALARDRLNGAELRKTLAIGAAWFVDFPSLSGGAASPDFREYVADHMVPVRTGPAFTIYRFFPAGIPGAIRPGDSGASVPARSGAHAPP